MLVYIDMVNGPRAIVPLLDHNLDVGLNLFNILVTSPIINFKAPNVSYKLSLNDINYYLPLVSDV
jgi:hypothetical protein